MMNPVNLSKTLIPKALESLVAVTTKKKPLGANTPTAEWSRSLSATGQALYANRNDRFNIDFSVERLEFPEKQILDPRIVRLAPGKNNELHRHAHESLFVILQGQGEVRVGQTRTPVQQGDLAFVPRWAFHQTRNLSQTEPLVLLAITDFGFTGAVLGDYDKRTRLANGGVDSRAV